ncbi:MAG TPA: SHOCT domain-containing protein [Candidatus Sulfotelmatobacter sp.]|jgi:uncharacterized membrane protein|nr:SHOCT domain-containing protein [Candidatus Sulfotelmatobacter sp.]
MMMWNNAPMMDAAGSGWFLLPMGLHFLLVAVLVALAVTYTVHVIRKIRKAPAGAIDILRLRFANGEISAEEFSERRKELQS